MAALIPSQEFLSPFPSTLRNSLNQRFGRFGHRFSRRALSLTSGRLGFSRYRLWRSSRNGFFVPSAQGSGSRALRVPEEGRAISSSTSGGVAENRAKVEVRP